MVDKTRNKVSVKIYEETLDLLAAEKDKHPRKQKPDYADLIEPAIAQFLKSPSAQTVKQKQNGSPRAHDAELKMLEFILDHGTKEDAAGITVNLKNFVEAIESREPQLRKHGKSVTGAA